MRFRKILPIVLILVLAPLLSAYAITIKVSSPAKLVSPGKYVVGLNQAVTFTARGIWSNPGVVTCFLEIDYGEGGAWTTMKGNCTCNTCNSCERSITHTYGKTGEYLIQVRHRIGCNPPPNPPLTASVILSVVPSITCPPSEGHELPPATPNVPYSHTLKAGGGLPPYTYTSNIGNTRLPHGLILNSSTGVISGIPTETGLRTFWIRVKDSAGQEVDCEYTLSVGPALTCPKNAPPAGEVGKSYSHQFFHQYVTQFNPPQVEYEYLGGLPKGLSLSRSGLISGIPAEAGRFSFRVRIVERTDPHDRGQVAECPYTLVINPASLTVTTTPRTFTLQKDISATKTPRYNFKTNGGINALLISKEGFFVVGGSEFSGVSRAGRGISSVGGKVIGKPVSKPLEVSLTNGTGSLTESISVAKDVIQEAAKLGFSRFTYVREWTSPATTSAISIVVFSIGSDLGGALTITDMRIYFENERPKFTVKRNRGKLMAFADLKVIGRGILEAHWLVDGRFHSRIIQHVDAGKGRILTISTPDPDRIGRRYLDAIGSKPMMFTPALGSYLQTLDEGTHEVELRIIQPRMDIDFPKAIYFVKAETELDIVLTEPGEGAEVDISTVKFRWSRPKSDLHYRIEFYSESDGEQPLFKAETPGKDSGNEYSIPSFIQKKQFAPGREVFWRIKALDDGGNTVGESEERRFVPKAAPSETTAPSDQSSSHVLGQILVLVKGDSDFQKLLESLGARHGLRLMEVHDLSSLGQKLAVFQTGKGIGPVIDALKNEPGLLLAGPNRILKTMAEPLEKEQNAYKTLHLDWLHNFNRGKGVLIAMVDTGADASHQDLKDRIVRYENFVKGSDYKAEIHGTATASLAAASINGFGITGVAPEADLLILRACRQISDADPTGECYTTSISRALDAAIMNQAKIVNLSVGCEGTDFLISRLLEEGEKRGMLFVAPAGNDPGQKAIPFPASHQSVIAVAGTDELGNPYLNPEIAQKARARAPAVNIMAAVPGDNHRRYSGTSLASATISGLLALACEKNDQLCLTDLPAYSGTLCKWEEELLQILPFRALLIKIFCHAQTDFAGEG